MRPTLQPITCTLAAAICLATPLLADTPSINIENTNASIDNFHQATTSHPATIAINLNNTPLTARITSVSNALGVQTYQGTIDHHPGSSFSIAHTQGTFVAAIRFHHKTITILPPAPTDPHKQLRAVTTTDFRPCGSCQHHHHHHTHLNETTHQHNHTPPLLTNSTINIDVLVAYTPDAVAAVGSPAATETLIAASLDALNQSLTNSNLPVQTTLVATYQTIESDSGNVFTDLNRIVSPTDSFFDELHILRDAYQADLVALITGGNDPSFCGVANIGPGEQAAAFSVTEYDCALGNLTFAHELGHNAGCRHDFPNSGLTEEHRWTDPAHNFTYRTVMALQPGTRIPYFSNPNVLFNNIPTGVPGVGPTSANNALQIQQTAAQIAAYRDGQPNITDCDANLIIDPLDIFFNPSIDCNDDTQIDTCQIADQSLDDCDNNLTPDICQLAPTLVNRTSSTRAISQSTVSDFIFQQLPPAADQSTVTITLNAQANLTSSAASIELSLNSTPLATVFTDANDCATPNQSGTLTISPQLLNSGGGVATIRARIIGDPAQGCTTPPTLSVNLAYTQINSIDQDADGIIDACQVCPGDVNNDNTVTLTDFSIILANFGTSQTRAGGDLTGDGFVSLADFSQVLSNFGTNCN